jgi:hypothetical protein
LKGVLVLLWRGAEGQTEEMSTPLSPETPQINRKELALELRCEVRHSPPYTFTQSILTKALFISWKLFSRWRMSMEIRHFLRPRLHTEHRISVMPRSQRETHCTFMSCRKGGPVAAQPRVKSNERGNPDG